MSTLLRRLGPDRAVVGWAVAAVAIGLFLVTRLVFLDRDLPPWDLSMYQPIDEFAYTIPAFNLHHYGTWTHQEVPYAPVEGSPMNILQSLVTAGTLALDWSYWGFRASSVLFGLIAFGAMLATVRSLVTRARADGVALPFDARWILIAAALLLLADFSFLVAGRVVEATTGRVAVIAVLLWLVARGTFLGAAHTQRRTFMLGAVVGCSVCFVYIYNAFLIPGALLAVAWWAARDHRPRTVLRHVALAGAGMGLAVVAYFGLVLLVYGDGPAGWYDTWVAPYRETGRATGFSPTALWTFLEANIFRLDRPLMVLALLALPAFAWWTRRSGDRLGIFSLSVLAAFVAQCTIQSDYPERKLLILLPFAITIVAGGLLRAGEWRSWVVERPGRRVAAVAWGMAIVIGTLLVVLPPGWTHWTYLQGMLDLPAARSVSYRIGTAGTLIAAGAVVGLAAAVTLYVGWRRAIVARLAGLVILGAMLLPLAYLDRTYVFANVKSTYRDAMIDIGPTVNGQITAGGSSYAMQLYNSSRPVFEGYVYGMSQADYDQGLTRYFAEGRATSLLGYVNLEPGSRLERLGFRLVETYGIELPKGKRMGRYVYDPGRTIDEAP